MSGQAGAERERDAARRTADADDARTRIFASVVRLAPEHGFEMLRLRDIATDAGLSVGALQHHFRTRDDLLAAAAHWWATRRLERLESLEHADDDGDAWRTLERLIEHAADHTEVAHNAATWLALCDVAGRVDAMREAARTIYDAWGRTFREVVEAGVQRGQLDPLGSPAEVAAMLLAIIDGLEVAQNLGDPVSATPASTTLAVAMARAVVRPVAPA